MAANGEKVINLNDNNKKKKRKKKKKSGGAGVAQSAQSAPTAAQSVVTNASAVSSTSLIQPHSQQTGSSEILHANSKNSSSAAAIAVTSDTIVTTNANASTTTATITAASGTPTHTTAASANAATTSSNAVTSAPTRAAMIAPSTKASVVTTSSFSSSFSPSLSSSLSSFPSKSSIDTTGKTLSFVSPFFAMDHPEKQKAAALFFMVADLKLDTNGVLKVLEFGLGLESGLEPLVDQCLSSMVEKVKHKTQLPFLSEKEILKTLRQLTKNLPNDSMFQTSSTNIPKNTAASSITTSATPSALTTAASTIAASSITTRSTIATNTSSSAAKVTSTTTASAAATAAANAKSKIRTLFSDYACVHNRPHGKPFINFQTAPVLTLDHSEILRMVVINKILMHEMFVRAGCLENRPECQAFSRDYHVGLADTIQKKIKATRYVLKAASSSHGHGVFVVDKENLDITLKALLCSEDDLKKVKEEYCTKLIAKNMNIEQDLAQIDKWRDESSNFPSSFLVEGFCSAVPYVKENKPHEVTFRAVFLMPYENGLMEFEPIACYSKYPKLAMNESGSLRDKTVSSVWVADVKAHDIKQIYAQLSPVMTKVCREILHFDMPQYILKLMEPETPSSAITPPNLTAEAFNRYNGLFYANQYMEVLNTLQLNDKALECVRIFKTHIEKLGDEQDILYFELVESIAETLLLSGKIQTAYDQVSEYITTAMSNRKLIQTIPQTIARLLLVRTTIINEMLADPSVLPSENFSETITALHQQQEADKKVITSLVKEGEDQFLQDLKEKLVFLVLKRKKIFAEIETTRNYVALFNRTTDEAVLKHLAALLLTAGQDSIAKEKAVTELKRVMQTKPTPNLRQPIISPYQSPFQLNLAQLPQFQVTLMDLALYCENFAFAAELVSSDVFLPSFDAYYQPNLNNLFKSFDQDLATHIERLKFRILATKRGIGGFDVPVDPKEESNSVVLEKIAQLLKKSSTLEERNQATMQIDLLLKKRRTTKVNLNTLMSNGKYPLEFAIWDNGNAQAAGILIMHGAVWSPESRELALRMPKIGAAMKTLEETVKKKKEQHQEANRAAEGEIVTNLFAEDKKKNEARRSDLNKINETFKLDLQKIQQYVIDYAGIIHDYSHDTNIVTIVAESEFGKNKQTLLEIFKDSICFSSILLGGFVNIEIDERGALSTRYVHQFFSKLQQFNQNTIAVKEKIGKLPTPLDTKTRDMVDKINVIVSAFFKKMKQFMLKHTDGYAKCFQSLINESLYEMVWNIDEKEHNEFIAINTAYLKIIEEKMRTLIKEVEGIFEPLRANFGEAFLDYRKYYLDQLTGRYRVIMATTEKAALNTVGKFVLLSDADMQIDFYTAKQKIMDRVVVEQMKSVNRPISKDEVQSLLKAKNDESTASSAAASTTASHEAAREGERIIAKMREQVRREKAREEAMLQSTIDSMNKQKMDSLAKLETEKNQAKSAILNAVAKLSKEERLLMNEILQGINSRNSKAEGYIESIAEKLNLNYRKTNKSGGGGIFTVYKTPVNFHHNHKPKQKGMLDDGFIAAFRKALNAIGITQADFTTDKPSASASATAANPNAANK